MDACSILLSTPLAGSWASDLPGHNVGDSAREKVKIPPQQKKFSKENNNLKILGGIMGKEILDVAAVANVATLPTLDEARAKIVGIFSSPAQKILSILLAPGSKIAILAHAKSKKN